MKAIPQPHIDSFNFMLDEAFPLLVQGLEKQEFEFNGHDITMWIETAHINRPTLRASRQDGSAEEVTPAECRQRHCSYKGDLQVLIIN